MPEYKRPYFPACPATEPTDLLGTSGSPTAISASAWTNSTGVNVDSHKFVVFFVYVAAQSTATKLKIQIEAGPDGSSWQPLQTEDITTGVAVQSNYQIEKAVPGTGFIMSIPIPTRGLAHFRIALKSDAGTPTVYVKYRGSGGPI